MKKILTLILSYLLFNIINISSSFSSDVDKARDLIGYNPSWPLVKGYPEYISWYKNFVKEKPNLIK